MLRLKKIFVTSCKRLLEADGKLALNRFDYLSRTALMCAIQAGKLATAHMLISAGADVNAHDEEKIGNTALHDAAGKGRYNAVALLIQAGADPLIPGWMGLTAIDKAQERQDDEGKRILALLQSKKC